MGADRQVLAAGGVLLREREGTPQVLVVHRPKYDDWSLPKGKLDPGEGFEDAARREIEEETGVTARLNGELAPTHYVDRRGRPKTVRWWTMVPVAARARPPDDEIDEVRWIPIDEAARLLTYDSDRAVLTEATATEPARTSVLLLRHALAGKREEWDDDDRLRPLSRRGWRQAEALDRRLDTYEITRIITSPYTRCVQSVEPLAAARGLEIEVDDRLAEAQPLEATLELLRKVGNGTVLCSHGDVVGGVVEHLQPPRDGNGRWHWRKGSTWVLTVDRDLRCLHARYLAPPTADRATSRTGRE